MNRPILFLLFAIFISSCQFLVASHPAQVKTSPYIPLRDVYQIGSTLTNGSLVELFDSLVIANSEQNQLGNTNIFMDPHHHALSYYHSVLSQMDLLVYFHTHDDCTREYNIHANTLLDSIVNGIEKVRGKYGKHFNREDETLFTTPELQAVNLKVAQFNCLSSEYDGLLCDRILGEGWRGECEKQSLPSFLELSLGMKTSFNY